MTLPLSFRAQREILGQRAGFLPSVEMTLLCHAERGEKSKGSGTGFLPSVEMTLLCHSERSEKSWGSGQDFSLRSK